MLNFTLGGFMHCAWHIHVACSFCVTTRNLLTHVFDLCPNQQFLWLSFQLSSMACGKNTYSHIFNYKTVLHCKCNYDLWLLLVWTKMRMKNVFTSSTIDDIQQYQCANLVVFATCNVVHRWLDNMWHIFWLELYL
jgi:hypothetical protein